MVRCIWPFKVIALSVMRALDCAHRHGGAVHLDLHDPVEVARGCADGQGRHVAELGLSASTADMRLSDCGLVGASSGRELGSSGDPNV